MELDRDFMREVKAVNGDGTREAKFKFLAKLDAAAKDLSSPRVMDQFADMRKKHGRATVAICVAATISMRREHMGKRQLQWADAVLDLWTNKHASNVSRGYIDDCLHPTRVIQYVGPLMESTILGA